MAFRPWKIEANELSASEIHSAKTCKRPQTGLHAALPFRIYDYLPTPFVTDQPLYGWTMQLQHTLLYPRSSLSCSNTAPRQGASIENPPLTLRPPHGGPPPTPGGSLHCHFFLSDEKVSYTSSQKVAISEGNGKSALRSFCNGLYGRKDGVISGPWASPRMSTSACSTDPLWVLPNLAGGVQLFFDETCRRDQDGNPMSQGHHLSCFPFAILQKCPGVLEKVICSRNMSVMTDEPQGCS